MKRAALVSVLVLLFGVVRVPMEHAVSQSHKAAFFRGAELNLELREQIGQGAFLAALSGFRSLVADGLWIQGHTAWQRTEWGRMAYIFTNVTTLQPRVIMFWDLSAWHMAWNASVAAYYDESQPREVLRLRAQREYFDLGRDFLDRGIANNPDKWDLYDKMAILLRDKYEDHCGAAEYFGKAAEFPEAPAYVKRMAAYELAKCPGQERKAYERLVQLYNDFPDERQLTMRTLIREMQESLEIPAEQRIYIPEE